MSTQKNIIEQVFPETLKILSDLIKFQTISGTSNIKLIEYCEKGNNHDENPLKLYLKYINREIDLGFYSRNRSINLESSMSVLG